MPTFSFQEERCHRPREKTCAERRPVYMILRNCLFVVIIVSQVCRSYKLFKLHTGQIDVDILLEMPFVMSGMATVPFVFSKALTYTFSALVASVRTDPGLCNAEISCKGPKATGNVEAVAHEADEDVVERVVLRAPLVQIARAVATDESVVPKRRELYRHS